MQSPEQMIREKRMRCTPQRIAVLRAVASHDRHLSAEEIYAFVHTSMPALSLATVYAILEMFTREAIVDEIRITFQKSLYELHRGPHHHFLCRQCGMIVDIDRGPCPVYKEKLPEGHRVESFQGYFYGVCHDCSRKRKG